jgi:hypothetical protein
VHLGQLRLGCGDRHREPACGIRREGAARTTRSPVLSSLTAFLVAFLIYEGALFAATAVLPSSAAAFSLPVIARILGINVCAVVGLAAIHWLAVRIGLQPRRFAEHVALSHG